MEDIEVPRRTITFADEKEQTDGTMSKIGDDTRNGTTLQEDKDKSAFTMEEQLPDRGDFGGGDFLEDGFGFGDGGLEGLDNLGGEVPGVSDIVLEGAQQGDKEGMNL